MLWHQVLPLQFCILTVFCAVDWPVFFENLGAVNSIHNKWELTFSVNTDFDEFKAIIERLINDIDVMKPSFPPQDIKSKSKLADDDDAIELSNENAAFSAVNDHWQRISKSFLRRAKNMKAKIEDIKTLGNNMSRRGKTKKKYKTENGKKRVKRQLGNYSGFLQMLFGVAYTDNVKQVKNELEDIQRKLNSDVGNLVNEQNRASNKLETKIKETNTKVRKMEDMTSSLEDKVDGMEQGGLLKSPTKSLMEKIHTVLQELGTKISECEVYLSEVEMVLTSLAGGRLPPLLVPAKLLRRHLEIVEKNLPGNYALLYPSTESLWPYFSVVSTSIYFSEDFEDMFVHISIPLLDLSSNLQLYRVHNLPLKVRNGYSVTADISPEYILSGKDGDYHLELSKEDFQDCKVYQKDGQKFFCGFKPLLQSSKHQTCVIQLFNKQMDGALCQSKVTHGLVQPFSRLYNGSWVFAALSTQVPVVLTCPNKTVPTSLLGFGVINLMEGCTLSSDDFFYPHTFSGYSNMDLVINISEHSNGHGEDPTTSDEQKEHQKLEEDEEYYLDQFGLEGLHQIESYDDYENGFETEIISAVVAEEDGDSEGLNAIGNESYLSYNFSQSLSPIKNLTSPTLELSEEKASLTEVSSNANNTDDIPVNTDMPVDTRTENTNSMIEDTKPGSPALRILTKKHFKKPQNENSVVDIVKKVLNYQKEDNNIETDVHHNMLVSLKDKISSGKHWLDSYKSSTEIY